jgi:hypothetical protein
MLTVVFILENNYSTITECLNSLDCLSDYISNYHVQSYYSEDYETLDILKKWGQSKSIDKITKIDKSSIPFYIYGNEKISQCNLINADINKLYNCKIYNYGYLTSENRINGFLENTQSDIDITIEKILEDPIEIQRRAFNTLINQLDTKPDYIHIAHLFRVGGNKTKALETLLIEKDEFNKTAKYYNELILATDKKSEYIIDFYRNYSNILDASYYYLEYLYTNKLYNLLYTVLYQGYTHYNEILTNNIQREYNRLVSEIKDSNILKESQNINLEKVNVILNGEIVWDNVLRYKSKLMLVNKVNLLESKIYDCDWSKITIIGHLEVNSDSFNYIPNDSSGTLVVYFNEKNYEIAEDSLCEYLKTPELLKFALNNNLMNLINKLYLFRNNLIFLDTIAIHSSIQYFITNFSTELNPIYIGLSQNMFNAELSKLIDGFRHLTVSNCNPKFIKDSSLLFKEIGLDTSSYFVIKYQSKNDDVSEEKEGLLNLLEETDNLQNENKKERVDCFVINLESREDRMNKLRENYGEIFNIKRISALEHTLGWVGCFQSHQRCLRIAKNENLKTLLVLEDDCCLYDKDNFLNEWKEIKQWLDNNLDKWEIFLGGCTNLRQENVIGYFNKPLGLVRLNFATTAHFIYYNSSIFDKIIDFNLDYKNRYTPIDLLLCEVVKDKIITRIPFLAKQDNNFSNIEKRLVNYDQMFKTSLEIILKKLGEVKVKTIDTEITPKEKKIISPILMGGLGNRMFQIASAYGIAKEQGKELEIINVLPNKHSDMDYFKNIFSRVKHSRRSDDLNYLTTNIFKEPEGKALVHTDILNIEEDMKILGYFQCEKYFIKYRKEILDLFRMSNDRKEKLINKYPKVNEKYFIHFRRGDYLEFFIHLIDYTVYYEKSINFLEEREKNIEYIIFSDDIEFCKTLHLLKRRNVQFVEDLDELDSLYLMTLCKGGIGVNSTFSWWGGWLNENPVKTVIYPSRWFNNDWEVELGWEGCWINNFEKDEIVNNRSLV